MSQNNYSVRAILGIALILSLSSCVHQFYSSRIPCENTSLGQAGILGDNDHFEFHRYRVAYSDVAFARIDQKGGRFYVVVKTRSGKKYSYFTTSQKQAENIYNLIACKANL